MASKKPFSKVVKSEMEEVLDRQKVGKDRGKLLGLDKNTRGTGTDITLNIELENGEDEQIHADGISITVAPDVKVGDTIRLVAITPTTAQWKVSSANDGEGNIRKKASGRRPFTAESLLSENGLPRILKHFPNIRFKGRGHEAEDLHKLIGCYREWANSLHPKINFHVMTRQIERMGSKAQVKYELDRLRRSVHAAANPRSVPEAKEGGADAVAPSSAARAPAKPQAAAGSDDDDYQLYMDDWAAPPEAAPAGGSSESNSSSSSSSSSSSQQQQQQQQQQQASGVDQAAMRDYYDDEPAGGALAADLMPEDEIDYDQVPEAVHDQLAASFSSSSATALPADVQDLNQILDDL